MGFMDKQILYSSLTPYFLRENHIDTAKDYEILTVPARTLLRPERFDLMAKWIYIDALVHNVDPAWARNIYRDNIDAFSCGKFVEPGTETKNSFEGYYTDFERLISNIREGGFDERISLIPVGANDVLLDGAHRTAAAAYFDKTVTIIRFPTLTRQYGYQHFRKYLMSDISMGYMAAQYARLKENCFFACLWPAADRSRIKDVTETISHGGNIVYEQDVYLTYRGMCNFMSQIYGHQSWTGSIENRFSGVEAKARRCYREGYPIHTYLFESESLERVLRIKQKIRSLFDLENHSVHISDTTSETRMMADMLYSPNTVYFLDFAVPYRYDRVYRSVIELKDLIERNHLDRGRFIIDSSSVLEVCGLRPARDLDFLTDYSGQAIQNEPERGNTDAIENHSSQLPFHGIQVGDMLYNPDNYFVYYGMKFLSLARLTEMKRRRNEPKDRKDARLIKRFTKKIKTIPRRHRYEFLEKAVTKMKANGMYGSFEPNYGKYRVWSLKRKLYFLRKPYRLARRFARVLTPPHLAKYARVWVLRAQRKRLKNRDVTIIASNCNGGALSSDLGMPFRSPFVNLFIRADGFIKLCYDLRGYMAEELRFVKEEDPVYGWVDYPTAYLRDVKIYFMHYRSEEEASDAWIRRKKRMNWDNLWFMFTDRSGCTQKELEEFDRLPYEHKVVFTHLPHPEIRSAVYIKGYEDQEKVGVLTEFPNKHFPVKRAYDQFDFVRWFNDGIKRTELE